MTNSDRYYKYPFNSRITIIRLTSFTDYGLRILMVMARAPELALTTAAMAQALGLSRHHLAKILQQLARGGNCPLDPCCRRKARLRSAERAFLADLDQSTLADVMLPPVRAA